MSQNRHQRLFIAVISMMAILFVLVIRLIAPFALFRFPLAGAGLVLVLDTADYWFVGTIDGGRYLADYQGMDKYLDLYGITFFAISALRWKEPFLRILGMILFGMRFSGILIFEATGMRAFLFFLPNIFENFYLLVEAGKANPHYEGTRVWQYAALLLVTAALPKIFQEYFMHYLEYPLGIGTIWREIGEFRKSL